MLYHKQRAKLYYSPISQNSHSQQAILYTLALLIRSLVAVVVVYLINTFVFSTELASITNLSVLNVTTYKNVYFYYLYLSLGKILKL